MFDKLIVSEPEGADFKNRRNYFMGSSLVVGVMFLTAVVFSIFAADFGLGNDNFELTTMMVPPELATVEREPLKPREPTAATPEQSTVATRRVLIAPIDQPSVAPVTISTAPNQYASMPNGPVEIGDRDTTPSGSGRPDSVTGPSGPALITTPEVVETATIPDPPPIKAPPVRPPTQTLGVINGRATYLPPPPYPPPAKAIGLSGKVDVQVTIDESGKVVSANAVSGHPFLKGAAEKAAWSARFSPTYLSKVPVKVTGVIVYNFIR